MTVKELRERLSEVPDETVVVVEFEGDLFAVTRGEPVKAISMGDGAWFEAPDGTYKDAEKDTLFVIM